MERQKHIKVRRITIDSKLTDTTFRLAICPLITRLRVFTDKQEDWGYEKAYLLSRTNFKNVLQKWGLPKAKVKEMSWHKLKEGQVYLLGTFRVEEIKIRPKNKGGKKDVAGRAIKRFVVDPNHFNFERIDEWVHAILKRLYFSTLSRRHVRGSAAETGR